MAELIVDGYELKAIPERDGYFATADGRIWSTRPRNKWAKPPNSPRQLKPAVRGGNSKYFVVSVPNNSGKFQSEYVHHLVLLAFVGPCPEGCECCHGPRGRLENGIDNLRWDTPKANGGDRKACGTSRPGQNNPQAKITNYLADKIRAVYDGERGSILRLARVVGIDPSCIRKILANKSYRSELK